MTALWHTLLSVGYQPGDLAPWAGGAGSVAAVEGAMFLSAAFLPALWFLHQATTSWSAHRGSGWALRYAFVWGATAGALVALAVNLWARDLLGTQGVRFLVMAAIVAPLVEETTKGSTFFALRGEMRRPVDGMVLGAASGLGFAATENLLYGVSAAAGGGTMAWVSTMVVRTYTATLLHAVASGLVGFGVVLYRSGRRLQAVAGVGCGVVLHAAFNAVSVLLTPYGAWFLIPVVWAAVLAFNRMRLRIVTDVRRSRVLPSDPVRSNGSLS